MISPYFFPHIGGSQRYMEELYVHIHEQFPHVSIDVLTYNTNHAPANETYRGLTIYRIPCWDILPEQFVLPNPVQLLLFLFRMAKKRYSFVHTHVRFFEATWWAWLYAKIIGATSIFTEHVSGRSTHENPTVELVMNTLDQTLTAWSMPQYNIVTTTNKAAQQYLNRTYHLPQMVQLVYGGVDTTYFQPVKQGERMIPVIRKKLKQTDTVISFVGKLIWAKGAIKLYRAYCKLLPKIQKNVYLAIAGDGVLAENIQKQIRQDNLSDHVIFLGSLDPKHVRQLLQASDIFVHLSHYHEGFSNVILEAGAAGNYIIATDIAGTREIIYPKKTGALIPIDDERALTNAITWALRNKLKTRSMGSNLRKLLIKEYDWIEISNSYMRLLISNNNSKTAKT